MDTKAINASLVDAFKKGISSLSYFDGAKGDSIDNVVVNVIKRYCPFFDVIELPAWLKMSNSDKYSPIRSAVQRASRSDCYDCSSITVNTYYDKPLLIRQPNNTQQFPDLVIVIGNNCLNIEIKSSKHDQIVWNSGLPRKDAVYIYNGVGISKDNTVGTTFFLGQHTISETERVILLRARELNHRISKEYNTQLVNSCWSIYARPMFNYTGQFLSHPDRRKREQDVEDFLLKFQWNGVKS